VCIHYIVIDVKLHRSDFDFQVTYSYKLRIDKNTGDPLNSHCECPAGRGPHGDVCLMIEDFTVNGKIRIAKSATENLMSFNKPKSSYRGK
jgi:hypothetical protein